MPVDYHLSYIRVTNVLRWTLDDLPDRVGLYVTVDSSIIKYYILAVSLSVRSVFLCWGVVKHSFIHSLSLSIFLSVCLYKCVCVCVCVCDGDVSADSDLPQGGGVRFAMCPTSRFQMDAILFYRLFVL